MPHIDAFTQQRETESHLLRDATSTALIMPVKVAKPKAKTFFGLNTTKIMSLDAAVSVN